MDPIYIILPGSHRKSKAQTCYHFIGAKRMFGGAFKYFQIGVTGIVQLIGIFEKYVFEECGPDGGFDAHIPSPELKGRLVCLTEKFIFNMWDHRPDAYFAQEVNFDIPFFGRIPLPAFYNIKKQEIGAIVEIIVKPVGCGKIDRTVNGPFMEGALYPGGLVCKYVFGMVEIYFECNALFLVHKEAKTVAVLRD